MTNIHRGEPRNRKLVAVVAAAVIGLVMLMAGACSDDTADDRPGEPATYARIEALIDCDELQSEFDGFMAVFDAQEPGTERAIVAVAYAVAADDKMRAIGC